MKTSAALPAIGIALLVLAVIAGAGAAERSAPPPNIVIILADDLGHGDLACYGNKAIKTPHLDKLAAEGICFTDFHSSGSVCCPTRAGLITGRYQQRVGMPANIGESSDQGVFPEETTFAEALKSAGYRTGLIGKWHLGNLPKYSPNAQGFDYFRGMRWGKIDYFSHVSSANRVADWWENDKLVPEEGYSTHLITQHAMKFIEGSKDRPFCLYVAYNAPHAPYQGPNDKALYRIGVQSTEDGPKSIDVYAQMIGAMDEGIGRIVATLKRTNRERNTLVFFFSDNGPVSAGTTGGLRAAKGSVYEGGHRVPAIAYWPGRIAPGQTCRELAISLDLFPTMIELAGARADPQRPLDGRSLLPLLRGEKRPPDRTLFWAHRNGKAARQGDWKYVVQTGPNGGTALYNLAIDIAEKKDLSPQEPERVRFLAQALADWEKDVGYQSAMTINRPATDQR